MNFHVVPGFSHKTDEPRWFVCPLRPQDVEYARGYRFQIQFLDDEERGGASIEFAGEEDQFHLIHLDLPTAVIEAAKSGLNDFVDAQGQRRFPGFMGGGKTDPSHA